MNGSSHARVLALLVVLLVSFPAMAEIYEYTDGEGTVHFVDDVSRVPREYRRHIQVHQDSVDEQPPEERLRRLEEVRGERERRRLEMSRKDEEQERQRRSQTTPVVVRGNQVFVPVTLANGGATTEALLLLDTGATVTTITTEVAERLRIEEMENAAVQVAGGKSLRAGRIKLSSLHAGPFTRTGMNVIVIRQRGNGMGDGLLGMDFLRGVAYRIDFARATITWDGDVSHN